MLDMGCSTSKIRLVGPAWSFIVVVFMCGCASQRPLMPTPNVYALGIESAFDTSLPEELRTTESRILFATDRMPKVGANGQTDFGTKRSPSLAFGEAVVAITGSDSWQDLVADAQSNKRSQSLNLKLHSVAELARSPNYPLPYRVEDGFPMIEEKTAREMQDLKKLVHESLRQRLDALPRKELLLYVHGVKTTFNEAIFTAAELWHFLGREFLPVAYSWPAGKGGAIKGYNYDRESSEFTIFHFKRFLSWLSSLPEVEGIHIIAHSRGTDVVISGIRELAMESWAAGERPLERFKLRNVVLAAPDINVELELQRTQAEKVNLAAERWTTYASSRDRAIGASEFLFGGNRVGKARYEALDEQTRYYLDYMKEHLQDREALVEYQGRFGGSFGHDYYRKNPAISSDLVLTIRFGRDPGAANGRPLEHKGNIFWSIDDDYLQGREEKPSDR